MGDFIEAILDSALDTDMDTAKLLGTILLWIAVIPFMLLLPFMKIPK